MAGARLSIRMHAQDFLVQGNCGVVAEGGGDITLRWCLDEIIAHPGATTASAR